MEKRNLQASLKPIPYLKIARFGFFLDAAIWIILGLNRLITSYGKTGSSTLMIVIAILMFGNAGAFLFCGFTIGIRKPILFWFSVLVLVVNILLTVTDQFGWLDLITILVDLVILGFLMVGRKKILCIGLPG